MKHIALICWHILSFIILISGVAILFKEGINSEPASLRLILGLICSLVARSIEHEIREEKQG